MSAATEPAYNAAGTHVWMHNPATGGVWDAPVEAVDGLEARGWEYTDRPDDITDRLYDDPAQVPSLFDPTAHTVAEVNEHLEKHVDLPGEVDRVLALEAAGKDRKTIVDPRPAEDEDPVDDSTTINPATDADPTTEE